MKLVGYEDIEARSPLIFISWVVHTARINAEKIIENLLLKSNNQIRNVKIIYI